MVTQKNNFLVLYVFILNITLLCGMQEQLNHDTFSSTSIPQRSQYRLALPINLAMMSDQINEFNKRMEKAGISAEFKDDQNYNKLVIFYSLLPYSKNERIQLHQIVMPYDENFPLNDVGTRTQLRRRFESSIEEHVEKLHNTIKTEAIKKYNNSWKKKFYTKVFPSVLDRISAKVASDITKFFKKTMPLSLQERINPSIVNIKDVQLLISQIKDSESKLQEIQSLSIALAQAQELLDSLPPEKKDEKLALQAEVYNEFCTLFEQQIAKPIG